MRRTVLSAAALAFTAVLATALPAFADDTSPTVAPQEASAAPSTVPSPATEPPSSAEPTRAPNDGDAGPVPSQVSVVPSGAPDTGATPEWEGSGSAVLAGTGATAVLLGGGAAVVLVRRRRANGA
ncbi:sortase-dependent protein [Streptomyces europaeiscabiei]|uniref:sortase-dependent protein n=1 Tax=Streptomyces europaeiscabiei TaxID=146819 RepID=UPI0029AB6C94|nr:sortase-dependent protein [Streptomyces europaeiscabiei]MDX2523187.1 Tat pathway signal sequence domain protein [Streptomyces europaeiscabiei]